jgi:hypothetical protein
LSSFLIKYKLSVDVGEELDLTVVGIGDMVGDVETLGLVVVGAADTEGGVGVTMEGHPSPTLFARSSLD